LAKQTQRGDDFSRRRAVIQRGLPDDPLDYDTSDFWACAKAMTEAALSGHNKSAVQEEIDTVERRLGFQQ
jgi:hypothetical protein